MQSSKRIDSSAPAFTRVLFGGLVSGLVAAFISNIYYYLYLAVSASPAYSEVNLISISVTCLLTNIVGALVYYGLARFTAQAQTIFVVGALALGLLSCVGNLLAPPHPNPGFALATVPLHLIAAIACAVLIPRIAAARA